MSYSRITESASHYLNLVATPWVFVECESAYLIAYVFVCLNVCMCMCLCACMCVCVQVCICVCVYVRGCECARERDLNAPSHAQLPNGQAPALGAEEV